MERRSNQNGPRRARGVPTIGDVATKAGVSPMTVSRVINGAPKVSAATRAHVDAIIQQMGYAPNQAARSLAGAEELRVGLLYSNPSATFFSEFLVGGLDVASRANLQLLVEQHPFPGVDAEAVAHFIRLGVDGVLLPPPWCDSSSVIAALRQAGIAVVLVACGRPPADISAVHIDDRQASYEMVCHLAALGHRRIGFIAGNPDQTASAQRRIGFDAALADMGLPVDPLLIAEGLFTYRSGLEAAEQLLGVKEPPSAIFASNDDMAAAAVAVAHRHGRDVPGDLTVCGFDDSVFATAIWPELTTVRQPIRTMSERAMELLLTEVRARRRSIRPVCQHVLADYTLVRRQSDAAPRQRPATRG